MDKIYNVRCYFFKTSFLSQTFKLLLILFIGLSGPFLYLSAGAQEEHPELKRVRGFEEYKKQKKLVEQDRERGLALHLESLEIEKREYQQALEEYRIQKKKEKPLEATPAYQEKIQERRDDHKKYAHDLEEFKEDKKIEKKQLEQAHLNKMEELGLPEDRPRFDLKKRVLYGAASPFGKSGNVSSGGSSSGGDSSGGYSPAPPPPSNFEEFPPPSSFPGEDNFDLPPPPPPMPFDDGSGMSGTNAPFDDFPPPPPPPPVDDFQF